MTQETQLGLIALAALAIFALFVLAFGWLGDRRADTPGPTPEQWAVALDQRGHVGLLTPVSTWDWQPTEIGLFWLLCLLTGCNVAAILRLVG